MKSEKSGHLLIELVPDRCTNHDFQSIKWMDEHMQEEDDDVKSRHQHRQEAEFQ